MSNTMTASRLRILLIATVVIIIFAVAGGFWYIHKNLRSYATEISKLNADAESGDSNIQTLQNLGAKIAERQQAVTDARNLIADSSAFPDRAVSDITKIAKETGVTITSIEYSEQAAASAAPSNTPAPAASAAPTTPQPSTTPSVPGVTKKSISVAIESPVRYSNLLQFIERIEKNELKMQIASVSIAKEKGDEVTTQPFSIGVYVR